VDAYWSSDTDGELIGDFEAPISYEEMLGSARRREAGHNEGELKLKKGHGLGA
jgi:hypothetical protein